MKAPKYPRLVAKRGNPPLGKNRPSGKPMPKQKGHPVRGRGRRG